MILQSLSHNIFSLIKFYLSIQLKTEFHICPLQPPLNQWVQFVWISKGENDTTKSRILPNGVIELILNFGNKQKTLKENTLKTDKYFNNYWVAGIQSKPLFIQSLTDTNLVGIRFLPGGAYPFFKFPISKLSDMVIEADWMAEELEKLRTTINDLSDHKKIAQTIEEYLWIKFDAFYAKFEAWRERATLEKQEILQFENMFQSFEHQPPEKKG